MIIEKLDTDTYKEIRSMASKKISDAKTRIKAKNKSKKYKGKSPLTVEIDQKFVLQLLRQSGCKCLYTGKYFVFEKHHPLNFSIDRIDSSKGYTPENVQVIGSWVNKAKSNLSEEEFLSLIASVNSENNCLQK